MKALTIIFTVFQIAIILLYSFFTTYEKKGRFQVADFLPVFMDVHSMVFIGFGFLMVFLKKYGFSAPGFSFLLAVFSIEVVILFNGFWNNFIIYDKMEHIALSV